MLTSQEKAYSQIKEWTLAARYKPNERLKTAEIATELSMSRTPVREALARLAQEGLVRSDSGWGYMVTEMRPADVVNLYRVRMLLEVEAAVQATSRMTPTALKSLETLLARCASLAGQGRTAEFLRKSRSFYQQIAQFSDNPILEQMLSTMNDRVVMLGGLLVGQYKSRSEEILKENHDVLAALRASDSQQVAEAVRRHIALGYERCLNFLFKVSGRSGADYDLSPGASNYLSLRRS